MFQCFEEYELSFFILEAPSFVCYGVSCLIGNGVRAIDHAPDPAALETELERLGPKVIIAAVFSSSSGGSYLTGMNMSGFALPLPVREVLPLLRTSDNSPQFVVID